MRTLIIGAHPDDTEFICGGTIASWIESGDEVRYVVVTSGERGLPPEAPDTTVREEEQRQAAAVLGVAGVDFLREPDGELQDSPTLRRQLVAAIRRCRPDRVVTHSPVHNLASVRFSHSDHLVVGRAAMAAVFPEARNPRYHTMLDDAPWTVPELWLCGVEAPNFVIDITPFFLKKLESVRRHQSQMRHFSNPDAFFREWAEEVAIRHNLAEQSLGEEFHRVSTA